MSRLLVLDCVSTACSIASFDDDRLLADHHVELGRGHAEHLVPMIASLPDQGQSVTIAVNIGPGSFTGVRIGLSVARALGLAWQARVVGYGALDLIAAHAPPGVPVCVIMHGGHGEFFTGLYDSDGKAEGPHNSLPPEQVLAAAQGRFALGNGITAPSLAALGLQGRYTTTRASDFLLLPPALWTDAAPAYGRAPDAQMKAAL